MNRYQRLPLTAGSYSAQRLSALWRNLHTTPLTGTLKLTSTKLVLVVTMGITPTPAPLLRTSAKTLSFAFIP